MSLRGSSWMLDTQVDDHAAVGPGSPANFSRKGRKVLVAFRPRITPGLALRFRKVLQISLQLH
jgi:hypothetical protein